MTKFIVVRHGNSLSNIDKTFTGHIDAPLSEVGVEQAKLVSNYILSEYKVDKVFSSDLSRAVDTIKPFAQKVNLEIIKEKVYAGAVFTTNDRGCPRSTEQWRTGYTFPQQTRLFGDC